MTWACHAVSVRVSRAQPGWGTGERTSTCEATEISRRQVLYRDAHASRGKVRGIRSGLAVRAIIVGMVVFSECRYVLSTHTNDEYALSPQHQIPGQIDKGMMTLRLTGIKDREKEGEREGHRERARGREKGRGAALSR